MYIERQLIELDIDRHLGAGQHLKRVFTRSTLAIKNEPLPKLDNINVTELTLMNGAARSY